MSVNSTATRPGINQANRWSVTQVAMPPLSLAQLACPAPHAFPCALAIHGLFFLPLCLPPTRSPHAPFTVPLTLDVLPVSVLR